MDSGASRHMTVYKSMLSNFKENKFLVKVEIGDNSIYVIKGIGSASFQLKSGSVLHIDEILLIPSLKKNLVSAAALEDKGYRVTFMDGKALLWSKNQEISSASVIGYREGGLYILPGHSTKTLVHDTVSPCELWHRRFGHLHYKALPGLQKIVKGMPDFQFEHDGICRGCVLGKNIKKSFPHSNKRSKVILDLVDFDICGPMLSPSLSGYLYSVIFIDDFSRSLGYIF